MNYSQYSPNRKHNVRIENIGEIRYGPQYCQVRLNGILLPEWYGMEFLWSEDSKYLALQQWLSTDQFKSPHTRIVLIDLEKMRISHFKDLKGGFAEPLKYEGPLLVFVKRFFSISGETGGEYETNIEKIENWKSIAPKSEETSREDQARDEKIDSQVSSPPKFLGYKEAIDSLLSPFMEKLGFRTDGVKYNGDGYEVEYRKENICLYYADYGRLDNPHLSLRIGEYGKSYDKLLKGYGFNEQNLDLGGWKAGGSLQLTNYEQTVKIIKSSFEAIVNKWEYDLSKIPKTAKVESKKEPPVAPMDFISEKAVEIKIGSESLLVKDVAIFKEVHASIVATEDRKRFFLEYTVPVGPYKIDIMAYEELSDSEILDFFNGKLDIDKLASEERERAIKERTCERKDVEHCHPKRPSKLSQFLKAIKNIFKI